MTAHTNDRHGSPRRGAALAVSAAVALTLSVQVAPALADELPTGEAVLASYVEATGGADAYEKIESRVMIGSFSMPSQGITLDIKMTLTKSGQMLMEMNSDVLGSIRRGVTGDVAWEASTMTGPRLLEGDEKADLLREGKIDLFAHWQDAWESAENTGVEERDGKSVYAVVLTPADGPPTTVYFDVESKLVVGTKSTARTAGGDLQVDSSLSEYKDVDGLLIPHTLEAEVMGQARMITTSSIEHNVEIAESTFALPEDIKALLAEKTATE